MIRSSYPTPAFSLARTFTLSVTCSVALTLPTIAFAQQIDEFGGYDPNRTSHVHESSRNFALELRFGPYLPRVDSEFSNGNTPFKDYYGTKHRFMVGAEFDWLPIVVPNVLRFGLGLGASYTTMSTKAPETNDPQVSSEQDTRLRVLPQWLIGVVRVDVLNRRTPIPLVFVGKLGAANGFWWVKDDPSANSAAGVKGHGLSYGAYYGIGMQLDLGVLDPYRAKHLDTFSGINNIYFYGELYGMELSSFGANDAMHIGDRSWILGFAMDF